MTRVADTSAIFAFFDEGDGHHRRAAADFANPDPILVPSEILVEAFQLIDGRMGHQSAMAALADLLGLPHIRIAENVHIEAVRRWYERGGGKLSLADSFVVETCRALGTQPLSYDSAILGALKQAI